MGARRPLHLITVHGTWGRGMFATPYPYDTTPAPWCRPGSPFMSAIEQGLRDDGIGYDVSHFIWSGANSILERDRAAHLLADALDTALATRPDALHAIIAHSHGGNLALRAIHILRETHAPDSETLSRLSLITIATPFFQIDVAYDSIARLVRFLNIPLLFLLTAATAAYSLADSGRGLRNGVSGIDFNVPLVAWIAFLLLFVRLLALGTGIGIERDAEKSTVNLMKSSYYPEYDGAFSFLIIRGIDDEASLALMFSAISNRIIDVAMALAAYAIILLSIILVLSLTAGAAGQVLGFDMNVKPTALYLTYTLLSVSAVAYLATRAADYLRTIYGWELRPMSFDASVFAQSVPDLAGPARVATLPRGKQPDLSILHSLYNHGLCASSILTWIRERRSAAPGSGAGRGRPLRGA